MLNSRTVMPSSGTLDVTLPNESVSGTPAFTPTETRTASVTLNCAKSTESEKSTIKIERERIHLAVVFLECLRSLFMYDSLPSGCGIRQPFGRSVPKTENSHDCG